MTCSVLRRCAAAVVLALALWLVPDSAQAQSCNVGSPTSMSFGSVNTTTGNQVDATASVTFFCNGTMNATVRVCPHLAAGSAGSAGANGPRYLAANANTLNYDVYTTSARTTRYANGVSPATSPEFLLVLSTPSFNDTGFASRTHTYHGRIAGSQAAAAAGTYTSTLSGGTQFDFGYSTTFTSCASSAGKQTRTHSFQATARNQVSCTVTTAPVAFPMRLSLQNAVDGTGAVNVTCTSGTPYTVALNGGQNGGTNAANRQMAKGADRITYGLYSDAARSSGWFSTGGTTVSGSGTGGAASLPVYGRVPVQSTPPAGNYTDTVTVTVTY